MPRHSLLLALTLALFASAARAQTALTPDQAEARAIFQQLIETNTSYKEGSTSPAAHAIAQRFLDAGFPAAVVQVLGPAGDKDSSVVVRMRGTSTTLNGAGPLSWPERELINATTSRLNQCLY